MTNATARQDVPHTTSDDETVLDVQGLTVEFLTASGWCPVVNDVSFDIGAGETVGLVGESGSGKSVTSMAIMGLIPTPPGRVTEGRVNFAGRDLRQLPKRDMEDIRGEEIAMIFQEPMTSLNPAFKVGEQIAEVVRRHRKVSRAEARDRAVAALASVGIPEPARRYGQYPHEFSGGMRQRVMIAMAIVCEPSLIIADEPTTALDVTIQAQVLDLLKDMRDRLGMAILFVTHDLGVVADICDRVVVMYAGQVVETGSIENIFAAPRHPYTSGLLSAMPQVGARTERLAVIPGTAPTPSDVMEGCRFHPRCPHAIDACRVEDVPLLSMGANDRLSRCLRSPDLELGGVS